MAKYHDELFEILLDQETMVAFNGGEVAWCTDKTYRCEGPDPTIFPLGEIPMKRVVLDENMEIVCNFPIAALFYAMAHRCGNVTGAPVAVMRVQLSQEGQHHGFFRSSLTPNPQEHTVAFNKTLTHENYAGVKDVVYHEMSEDVGQALLNLGYALLNKEVSIDGVNKFRECQSTVD